MKNSGTTRVNHNPGDPPVATDTDWTAVDAMSAEELHQAALSDVDALPLPDWEEIGVAKLVNIKKQRK